LIGLVLSIIAMTIAIIPIAANAQNRQERVAIRVEIPIGQLRIPVRTWRSLRDNRTVKQNLDYSCGSAAIATILNQYYGFAVSEEDILKAIDRGTLRATFNAMQQGVARFGFRAVGVATNFDQLRKLRMPVVVHVRYRKTDHFSVLRGIGSASVLLADPSLGNRTFSHRQFRAMWETRNSALAGKILAIFPTKAATTADETFFVNDPPRQTAMAARSVLLQSIAK
jgi:predicted double-glycine peptidase